MFSGLALVLLLGVISLVAWYLSHYNKIRRIVDKIPGPPGRYILGNSLELKSDAADYFRQLCDFGQEYGRKRGVFRLWLGPHPALMVVSAEAAESIFNSSKHMTKSMTYKLLEPWLGTGLLTSTGDKWHSRRKYLTPAFHFKILDDFQVVFNEQANVMVGLLDKMAGKGTFDILPFIALCALDIICETAMGCKIDAQANSDSQYVKAIYSISELILTRFKQPWLWPPFIYNNLPVGKRHQRCLDVLQGFTRKVIEERHAELERILDGSGKETPVQATITEEDIDAQIELYSRKGKKCLAFLDLLLYSARGENGLTFDDIQEEVDTFMVEGHDTTAAAMNWTCHLIGKHPVVQGRLQEEVDTVFGNKGGELSSKDIKDLHYLERVIKESLRIFPSVPIFGREISEDTEIAGYAVPKGTSAFIFAYSLHRDPRHFPDPETFDPDRWTAENAASRHPFCYVPFSAGLRNCIGQRFAMNEEKTMLAHIIHNFHITSKQKTEELILHGELILRPENGIHVELTRRH